MQCCHKLLSGTQQPDASKVMACMQEVHDILPSLLIAQIDIDDDKGAAWGCQKSTGSTK